MPPQMSRFAPFSCRGKHRDARLCSFLRRSGVVISGDMRRVRPFRFAGMLSLILGIGLSFALSLSGMNAIPGGSLPQPLPLFPADNWWNLDVSDWPVDPNSAKYIEFINNGGTRRLHPDLGGKAPTDDDPHGAYGIPYVVVTGVTAADLVPVEFQYWRESDGVDYATGQSLPFYPIPREAIASPYWIEGGTPGNVDLRSSQDRHLIIVDGDKRHLYELYNVFFDEAGRKWHAGSGAFFDLNTNNRRPNTWTSADAAGLAILPGLIRYDEVYGAASEIGHAFRVTVRATDGYVYPASHRAGSRAGALPMGARLRLKASVDVAQRTRDPNVRKIFRAMQKHGLIVADNGSDMYITGTHDTRWDNGVLNPAFRAFNASDFEVLVLGHNPPPVVEPDRRVNKVRAAVSRNRLEITWEPTPGASRYRVEMLDSVASAAGWRPAGESAQNSWATSIEVAVPERFYRVLVQE